MKFKRFLNESEKFIDKETIKYAITGLEYLLEDRYSSFGWNDERKKLLRILKRGGLPENLKDFKRLLNEKIPKVNYDELKTPEDVDAHNFCYVLWWLEWVEGKKSRIDNLSFTAGAEGGSWKIGKEIDDSLDEMLKVLGENKKLKEKLYDRLINGIE